MPPPWVNLLMAVVVFILGAPVLHLLGGWVWFFTFAALIAGALFQSYLIWFLVVLYVVGTLVVGSILAERAWNDPKRYRGTADQYDYNDGGGGP